MRDEGVLKRIADAAGLTGDDIVLEIGTGSGNLTKYLCEKAKFVYTVEKDTRLCRAAEENLKGIENVKIICDDILHVIARSPEGATKQSPCSKEIASLTSFARNDADGRLKIIGNLPYYITTPIIFKLLDQRRYISDIIIMIQKEVAQRIVASPGGKDYGILSCSVQFYTEPHILFCVGKGKFYPQPKVDSVLLRLKILEKPAVAVKNEENFLKVVKAAFSQRRKTLLNSLCGRLHLKKEDVESVLHKCGIEPKRRAETLSLAEFAKICYNIKTRENHEI